MKKIYIDYLGALLIHFGCHRGNRCGMFSPEQAKKGPIGPSQAIVDSIPRPIHQAATKQLIEAIPPNKAFCVLVTPEKCKELGLDFESFFYVAYSKDEQALLFYPKKLEPHILPIIQAYYSKHPLALQTIPITDLMDYNGLVDKTTPITMTPKSNYEEKQEDIGGMYALKMKIGFSNDSLYTGYQALDLNSIDRASSNIPAQVGETECCVNTAARALVLIGATINASNYGNFAYSCKNIPSKIVEPAEKVLKVGLGTMFSSAILACIPGVNVIVSPLIIAGWGSGLGGMVAGGFASNYSSTINGVGVDPWDLSKHINTYLPNSYSHSVPHCYDNFFECVRDIQYDIMQKDPVIALFFYEPRSIHYANVVATKADTSGNITEFITLDTHKGFCAITYENMEYLMYNSSKGVTTCVLWNDPKRNYYLIRFVPKK